MNISKDTLRSLFSQPYDTDVWLGFLNSFFGADNLKSKPIHLNTSTEDEDGFFLGDFTTSDNYSIGLFQFDISRSSVLRRRVGLRNLLRIYIRNNYDAALTVFCDKGGTAWRFSFISDLKEENTAPKRYTYIFGAQDGVYNTPVTRFMELYRKREGNPASFQNMKDAFSVEVLTNEFYGKLFKWFSWATGSESELHFPGSSNQEDISVKVIRLITRLLFVWFIREKGLVPGKIFDPSYLKGILKDFDPDSINDGCFYNAILQNLFFATLNRAIIDENGEHRRFATRKDNRDLRNLYRYAEMFSITQDEVVELFAKVPFLNGGLFECQDKFRKTDLQQEADCYLDGFSRNSTKDSAGNFKYRAFIPNRLFFSQNEDQPGLITLLNQYNFTIEENRATDAVVSLDPELLGRVFENLLASYNEETRETARKSTGSFYTPREIVDYMVDESLVEYLMSKCGEENRNTIRELVDGTAYTLPTDELSNTVITSLKEVRILDPACGSGAFPMGCLLRIVDIVERLQPDIDKYALKLELLENCIYGVDIQSIAMLICKLRFFISLICEQEHINFQDVENNFGIKTLPNLETKFVAANTLVAADLRTLYPDWATRDLHKTLFDMKDELLKIRRKHFHARSQYAKEKFRREDEEKCEEIRQYILQTQAKVDVKALQEAEARVTYFTEEIKKYPEKWEDDTDRQGRLFDDEPVTLFSRDVNKGKRDELRKIIERNQDIVRREKAKTVPDAFAAAVAQITRWNPYDQNASSPFFDPEWMFGVENGFDIVIGNPPYVEAKKLKKVVAAFRNNYQCGSGTADLSVYFYERGL